MGKREVVAYLRAEVTEERCDVAVAFLLGRARAVVPWWIPMGVVERVLDALLPEYLLDAVERALGASGP